MSLLVLPDRRLRLAFFGSPEFACAILGTLIAKDEDDLIMVVCQPDRPKGRGKKVEPPAVKSFAQRCGIEPIQPTKMKDGVLAEKVRSAQIDLIVVAAFGRILPRDILEAPRFGAWNVHASLLPRHRGASPINFAILEGDETTGVTLMQMTEGLDEGPMLLQRATPIGAEEDAQTLSSRLSELGAEALVEGLRLAKHTGLEVVPQDDGKATFAPLLSKELGRMDLSEPAPRLARKVRAFHPWPGTYLPWADGPLKVLAARAVGRQGPEPDGIVLEADGRLLLSTGSGALELITLQPPGKRPMSAADFLRGAGRGLRAGERFAPADSGASLDA